MTLKSLGLSAVFSALAAAAVATSASAQMVVHDAYARASNKMAGAAFMEIINEGDADDRLIGARSDVAKRVQLHTHTEDANGVMKMTHVEDGFAIPAGATHLLQRGGDHVMFMGLNRELAEGDTIDVILDFEKAGEVAIEVPVDMARMPEGGHGGHGDHSGHGDDHGDHSH